MKKIVSLSIVTLCSLNAYAINDPKFQWDMGTYLVASNDLEMSATTGKLVAASINVEEDLGMETETHNFRMKAQYRFSDYHRVEFAYYAIRGKAEKVIERRLSWKDKEYLVGTRVNSFADFDIYKLNYAYSFYHNEDVELSFAAGIHALEVDTGLRASLIGDIEKEYVNESVNVLAPLPVIGFRMDYELGKDFSMIAAADYFSLRVDDYSGLLVDVILGVEYDFIDNFSAGFAYNTTSLDIKAKKDYTFRVENDIRGLLFYVSYRL